VADFCVLESDAEGVSQAAKSVEPALRADRLNEEDTAEAFTDTVQTQKLPRVVRERQASVLVVGLQRG
jgi:hypothetical protein